MSEHEGFIQRNGPMVLAGAAAVGVGVLALHEGWLHLPHIDMPHISFGDASQPPHAQAELPPTSYYSEESAAMVCPKDSVIGTSVNVRGHQDGNAWLLFGDSNLNKRYYGDFLYCGDVDVLTTTVEVTRVDHHDGRGAVPETVTATFPGLRADHGRVDMSDGRNCADIQSDDTHKEEAEAIARYQKKVREAKAKHGDGPDCDDGISFTQFHEVPKDHMQLPILGQQLAQLTIELEADPVNPKSPIRHKVERMEREARTAMEEMLRGKYPGAKVFLYDTPKGEQDDAMIRRIEAIGEHYSDVFRELEFRKGEHKSDLPELYVESNGGGHATVKVHSITNRDVDAMNAILHKAEQHTTTG